MEIGLGRKIETLKIGGSTVKCNNIDNFKKNLSKKGTHLQIAITHKVAVNT